MKTLLVRARLRSVLIAAPSVALLAGFFVVPLLSIFWDSFEGTKLVLSNYQRVVTHQVHLAILAQTLKVGLLVTVLSVLIGYPVAYLLTKLKPRAFSLVSVFILIPLFTAFLIRTYAWIIILGREGIINNLLVWCGLVDAPLQILNTTLAVIIGMTHVFVPIAIFTMYSAMSRIDHSYMSAAQVLGAHPVCAFTRVYLPLTFPGIFSALILIFIVAIGFYITPALLGGPGDTMISQLIVTQMTTLFNFELAYASSIVLLLITLGILFIAGLVIPLEMIWSSSAAPTAPGRWQTGGVGLKKRIGVVFSPALAIFENALFVVVRPLLTGRNVWLWAYSAAVLFFLTAPLIVVVILSFSSSPFIVFPPPGLSLQWWQKLYAASDWHSAFLFSLQLGAAAAVGATVIGTMGAFWLVRTSLPFKRLIFLFSLAPLMVPVIIIAISLYMFEARLGILGTFTGLVFGHILLATPYVVVVMSAAVRNFDRTLEYAAAIHGARPLQTLAKVTLPILKPAVVTAALLAFLTSFDELLVSIFLLGRQTPTLPIKFWGDIKYQIDPLLSAASTLIVVMVTVTLLSAQWLRIRQQERTAKPQSS